MFTRARIKFARQLGGAGGIEPPPPETNRELREDFTIELREDGGIELREAVIGIPEDFRELREDGGLALREDGGLALREG